jgi:glycosyltransferase involved in cell wall biosynthesis
LNHFTLYDPSESIVAPSYSAFAQPDGIWLAPAQGYDVELLEQLQRTLGEAALARLGVFKIPSEFRLSVVIPAYNERGTIAEIIRRVQASPVPKEIIVVDDGSNDGTREMLAELCTNSRGPTARAANFDQTRTLAEAPYCEHDASGGELTVILHRQNQGKGAALRTGFAAAAGDVILVQDADLEYDPADYPRLLLPLIDGRADVVYGSRFLGGPARTHLFWHHVGNWLLTLCSNVTTNLNLTDMETGYKAFRREALSGIRIQQNRFGVEPELTAKFARRRLRFYEVPITYAGRDYAEGKKIGLKDGLVALWCILRYAVAS